MADVAEDSVIELLQRWGVSSSGIDGPALYALVGALLALVAFNVLRMFFAGEFSVAAQIGICTLAFLFGLALMWATEPFFGDHMSDSGKDTWAWATRIVIYIAVPVAVGWLVKRKGIRLAGRTRTPPKDGA